MAISSISSSTNALLEALQSNRTAAAASSSTESTAAASTTAQYDTVDISEEGSAYADAQAGDTADSSSSSSSLQTENAELSKSLNTVDSSGLSFVQQQEAALKAGVSAADLMGESDDSDDSSSLFSDLTDLLSGYTQASANNTILRYAGASALRVSSSSSTESTDSSSSDIDLSNYTVEELSFLLSEGTITAAQYLAELSSRQEAANETDSTDAVANTTAALGSTSE